MYLNRVFLPICPLFYPSTLSPTHGHIKAWVVRVILKPVLILWHFGSHVHDFLVRKYPFNIIFFSAWQTTQYEIKYDEIVSSRRKCTSSKTFCILHSSFLMVASYGSLLLCSFVCTYWHTFHGKKYIIQFILSLSSHIYQFSHLKLWFRNMHALYFPKWNVIKSFVLQY